MPGIYHPRYRSRPRNLPRARFVGSKIPAVSTPVTLTASLSQMPKVVRISGKVKSSSQASSALIRRAMAETKNLTVFLNSVNGNVAVGDQISAFWGDWSNSPTSYAYQWQKGLDPNPLATWTNISGETFSDIFITSGILGYYLRCQIIASNLGGDSETAYTDVVGPVYDPAASDTISLTYLLNRLFSLSQGQTITRLKTTNKPFARTVAQTISMQRANAKTRNIVQPSIISRVRDFTNIPFVSSATVTPNFSRATTKFPFASSIAQIINKSKIVSAVRLINISPLATMGNNNIAAQPFVAAVTTLAKVFFSQGRVISTSVSTAASLSRVLNSLSKILTASASATARKSAGLTKTFRASQGTTESIFGQRLSTTRTLSVIQHVSARMHSFKYEYPSAVKHYLQAAFTRFSNRRGG